MTSAAQETVLKVSMVAAAAALFVAHYYLEIPELHVLGGVVMGWALLRRPGDSAPVPRPPPRRERITILPKE